MPMDMSARCVIHEVEMVDGKFVKIDGTERELPADHVLLALGFVGPERGSWLDELGVEFDGRGNVARDAEFHDRVCPVCSSPATWDGDRA